MRRVLMSGGTLVLFLTMLVAVAMQLGEHLRPLPAVLARLSDCRPWCWQTIIPGQTSRTQADQVLVSLGYEEQFVQNGQTSPSAHFVTYRSLDDRDCTVTLFYDAGQSGKIRLLGCSNLTLGDVMAALGKPEEILPAMTVLSGNAVTVTSSSVGMGETLSFSFLGGYVIVFATSSADPDLPWFLPTSRIVSIELDPESVTSRLMPSSCRHTWQGFKPRLLYTPQISTTLC
jgi:hypothetical protein